MYIRRLLMKALVCRKSWNDSITRLRTTSNIFLLEGNAEETVHDFLTMWTINFSSSGRQKGYQGQYRRCQAGGCCGSPVATLFEEFCKRLGKVIRHGSCQPYYYKQKGMEPWNCSLESKLEIPYSEATRAPDPPPPSSTNACCLKERFFLPVDFGGGGVKVVICMRNLWVVYGRSPKSISLIV